MCLQKRFALASAGWEKVTFLGSPYFYFRIIFIFIYLKQSQTYRKVERIVQNTFFSNLRVSCGNDAPSLPFTLVLSHTRTFLYIDTMQP